MSRRFEPAHGGAVASQQPPQVRIPSAFAHAFRLVPFGRPTRWWRERGLVRALRTADPRFDARWTIETDDVEFAEALFRREDARTVVAALAELGTTSVAHDGRNLHAVFSPRERRRLRQTECQAAIAEQLRALDAIGAELARTRHFPQHRFHRRLFLGLLFASLALGLLAFAGIAWGAADLADGGLARLALDSLVGLPLAAGVVVAAIVPLSGRTTSHKEGGVLLVLLLPATMAACLAGATAINRLFDPGPVERHRVPVLEVRKRMDENHRHVTGYSAIVPSWRGAEGDTERLRFGRERGAALVAGSTWLQVDVSPGALGAARLVDVRIE